MKPVKARARTKKMHRAIKTALEMTHADGKTRYVMEEQDMFIPVTRYQLMRMKKMGKFRKDLTYNKLIAEACFIATKEKTLHYEWKNNRLKLKTQIEKR